MIDEGMKKEWEERMRYIDTAHEYRNFRELKVTLKGWHDLDKGYLAQTCFELMDDIEMLMEKFL